MYVRAWIMFVTLLISGFILYILGIHVGTEQYKAQEKIIKEQSKAFTMWWPIGAAPNYDIVCHEETKVMYAVSEDGVFTVLLNADGTPMIWEGEEP